MKRGAQLWVSVSISCLAGIGCAELAARSIVLRDKLGTISGHGHLLALVHGHGIYQSDVDRALRESDYASDIERSGAADFEQRATLNKLVANSAIQSHTSSGKIAAADLRHNIDLLRSQFPSEKAWQQSLVASGFSSSSLSEKLKENLGARQWIAKRVAPDLVVAEEECRRFYDSHSENFFVPEQVRVVHLFLAAPPEDPPEIVEAKRTEIEGLSVRLARGEDFAALTAETSEDEATKLNGGDLGYFSANRMPPDFVAAALKLSPGEISRPIRTRLGFHIIRSIDRQMPGQRSFQEVRDEIASDLANQKRDAAIKKLIVDLRGQAEYLRLL